jgi:hypothetical protein
VAYIGQGLPPGAFWGSNFEEYSHLDDLSRLHVHVETVARHSVTAGRHQQHRGHQLEPADPAQGGQPFDARTAAPSWDPTGDGDANHRPVTGRRDPALPVRFWQPQSTGADYWQSYGLLIGDDWKVDSNGNLIQVANNGTTFTNSAPAIATRPTVTTARAVASAACRRVSARATSSCRSVSTSTARCPRTVTAAST